MEGFPLPHTSVIFHLILGSETDLQVFCGGKICFGVIWSCARCECYPSPLAELIGTWQTPYERRPGAGLWLWLWGGEGSSALRGLVSCRSSSSTSVLMGGTRGCWFPMLRFHQRSAGLKCWVSLASFMLRVWY